MATKNAAVQAFYVKFYFSSKNRLDAAREDIRKLLLRTECYYAATYPQNRRPRRIRDGDVVYMACMTFNPIGYAVFGRASARAYRDGRDDATENEIARCEGKIAYPHYIRVVKPEFIDGHLSDCPYLQPIIESLGARAFASTSRNLASGRGNTDPKRALMQKPDVALTEGAALRLGAQFDQVLASVGQFPSSFVDGLPKPDTQPSD